ncbi:undecaprenyldiphospho-muramoylpentapeptide beta-N-acetylglucosaminyltransferase [Candidatus Poribacteria bacterium]|nr:undecaprenyldiphospho-muramoylpentapeptide beta-N-acetylglucosaminyltransferase [Candidatus Poribacteria bacterium]
MKRVLFAAGGTGGHVLPAITVANELRSRDLGIDIAFVGSRSRIEAQMVPDAGYRFISVAAAGFPGRLSVRWIPALATLGRSLVQVRSVLRRENPAAVFGTGGFVCGPLLAMAARQGIPTIIHESNTLAGKTNRWLGKSMTEVHVGFPDAVAGFGSSKARVSGNPIRPDILGVAHRRRERQGRNEVRTLVVLGGSQGSRQINDAIVSSLPELRRMSVRIVHQTGHGDHSAIQEAYKQSLNDDPVSEDVGALCATHDVRVEAFITDMAAVYAEADLVVCRAGAMTVSELAVCGVPAVFVPLPGSQDQPRNAAAAARAGAGVVMESSPLDAQALARTITSLLTDDARLGAMSAAWGSIARPDATRVLADAIERYL